MQKLRKFAQLIHRQILPEDYVYSLLELRYNQNKKKHFIYKYR